MCIILDVSAIVAFYVVLERPVKMLIFASHVL